MSARKRQRRADKSATHPNRRRGPENPTQTPVSETHRLLSFIATTSLVLGGAFIMVFGIFPVGDWLQGTPGQWKPVREWATAVAAIIAVAVLIAAVGREQVDQLVDRATQLIGRPSRRAFEWGMALVVFAFCAFLAQYCFAAQAATGDSMSMRFQARLLASGRLFAVPEAQREFFNTPEALDASGRWFSQFPVGWPLVLAVPMRFGIEWLVAPLLTALTVVWFYRLVAGVMADAPARWTAIMLAVSPWLLFLGSSQENHISVVALLMLALSALPTWVSSSDGRTIARSAALIGVAVASAAAIRPYDAALVGVVVGVFQLTNARTSLHRRSLVVQIAAGAIPLAVLLLANARTTGNPFLFAYDALNGPEHRPGFHMTPRGFVLTPTIGLIQTSGKLLRLSTALFEWPVPALALVAAGMLALARHPSRWDMLLFGLMMVTIAGYVAYGGESYFARGPRYLIASIPAFVWFAAQAVISRPRNARWRWVRLVIPLCTLVAWRPWLSPQAQSGVRDRANGLHLSGGPDRLDVESLVASSRIDNALVFVNETWRARLLTRLRLIGLRPARADLVVNNWDACAIQASLDDIDARPSTSEDPVERLRRQVMAAGPARPFPGARVSFAEKAEHGQGCLSELRRDGLGTLPFAMFLSRERFDPEGRLSGPVVFAIDYGDERNERLRARFGNRTWYRLRRTINAADTAYVIGPYR